MYQKRMALLLLAGSLQLTACGSPAAPQAGPVGASPAEAQPAVQAPAAQTPATQVGGTANVTPNTPGSASNVSGGSAAGAQAPTGKAKPTGGFNTSGGMGYVGNDLIVFFSDRRDIEHEGLNDIYVFDPVLDTVLALPGVNTKDNETNPRISDNGKWLVFQRGWGSGKHHEPEKINNDILMYNMGLKIVNTLPGLNTEDFDEYMPDVTDDGCFIVYVTNAIKEDVKEEDKEHLEEEADSIIKPEVRLYDVKTGDNWQVPGLNRNFKDVTWPTISANGKRIAYGASTLEADEDNFDNTFTPTGGGAVTGGALMFGESNIFVYDVVSGTQLTPPFLNTEFDEYNPDLCLDGSRLLFVSNRFGSEDVFEVNLDTGWIDNFSFLNTRDYDEQHPRYLGGSIERIVYQLKFLDDVSPISLRAYNRASATIDTLPVANDLIFSSGIRAPQPEIVVEEAP